jgi:hypothetical protein
MVQPWDVAGSVGDGHCVKADAGLHGSADAGDDPNFGGRGNRSSGDFFTAAPNIDHSQDFVKRDLQGEAGCSWGVWYSIVRWTGIGSPPGSKGMGSVAGKTTWLGGLGRAASPGRVEGLRLPRASLLVAEWLTWMRTCIGFDGWRLDYVRGFAGSHVKDYMEASRPQFAVGETPLLPAPLASAYAPPCLSPSCGLCLHCGSAALSTIPGARPPPPPPLHRRVLGRSAVRVGRHPLPQPGRPPQAHHQLDRCGGGPGHRL